MISPIDQAENSNQDGASLVQFEPNHVTPSLDRRSGPFMISVLVDFVFVILDTMQWWSKGSKKEDVEVPYYDPPRPYRHAEPRRRVLKRSQTQHLLTASESETSCNLMKLHELAVSSGKSADESGEIVGDMRMPSVDESLELPIAEVYLVVSTTRKISKN